MGTRRPDRLTKEPRQALHRLGAVRQPTLYTVLIIARVLNITGSSTVADLEAVPDLETVF